MKRIGMALISGAGHPLVTSAYQRRSSKSADRRPTNVDTAEDAKAVLTGTHTESAAPRDFSVCGGTGTLAVHVVHLGQKKAHGIKERHTMEPSKKGRSARRGGGSQRGSHRPWCLPLAVTREPGETLEGVHVLDEFPAELSLALWTALRDVSLWAATPEERRTALFSPNAEARRREYTAQTRLEPQLDLALGTLATVVSHSAQASAAVVSLMCLDVSKWAKQKGGMGTAVSFAQAAALASPEDPAPALSVGRLALEWGRPGRAETWLRRSIGLARRARDWESYGGACVTLAEIYLRGERLQPAERFFLYGARVARRQQLREVRAEAMHGLMRVRMAAGDDLEQAERFAHLAQRAYGRAHPRLPDLLHDISHLMVRRGEWERAVPLLRRQLSIFTDAGMRMVCHALLAQASAALGDARSYEMSWKEAWTLKDRPGTVPHVPTTLAHLGKAAARANDWLRVQQTVRAFNDLAPAHHRGCPAREMAELARLLDEHRNGRGAEQ
jgi:tetratricopeptide (TPR) repeat protein